MIWDKILPSRLEGGKGLVYLMKAGVTAVE